MKKKKTNSPFAWPFSRNRQCWIAEADRMVTHAEECVGNSAVKPFVDSQVTLVRRSAKVYIRAADVYRRAGLGLMAAECLRLAAECYSMLGDDSQCMDCESRAAAIPIYWSDEE